MKKSLAFLAAAIVVVLVLLGILSRFFVDLLWFGSLGLRSVFTTVWLTEITIFVVAAALSFAVLLVNGLLALQISSAGPRISRGFRVLGRSARARRVWFPVPLSIPCVRFSRTRLTDDLLDMVTQPSGSG